MITVNEIKNTVEVNASNIVVAHESDTQVITIVNKVIPLETVYTVEVNGPGIQGASGTNGTNGTTITPDTGWSVSNVSSDKTLDANSTSLDEIADVLGTLITTLKNLNILAS